ncbi:hypothetical protein ACKFKG_09840 [Phormidesmis sp. 146-35]
MSQSTPLLAYSSSGFGNALVMQELLNSFKDLPLRWAIAKKLYIF